MDVVFNVNHLGLIGLGATLSSLIRNCSDSSELKLWFLCSDFRKNDKIKIYQLLQEENFTGAVEYIDFDAKALFGHLRSLHGDWTGYGRLLIANYIKSDIALYLDSDLVIQLDVLTLKNFDFKGEVLAAVFGSQVILALEKAFFIDKLKWKEDTGYFNSGVVLFNLKKWRESNTEAKWKGIAKKYPKELLTIDQTLLNAVCEGKFAKLPPEFNNPWYPGKETPEKPGKSIIHFVGSPKPWDVFGKSLHKGYDTWHSYTTKFWEEEYCSLSADKVKRTWNIKRSVWRLIKNGVLIRN
ncbi:glycosyltransferase family 8 protein [Adhaeribacter aquaticus]|uniref:glycosyltransferase family 8 protein n=1 Tax=Adhaeribacter aquaticus TaxID=299567 RepID=UPI0004265EB4|nr:glycosyltransferase family 8 protein [Adhaeribacter aquaticus]